MWPAIWIIGAVIVGLAGINRRMGFFGAFGLGLLLSPLIGLIIVIGSRHRTARGCPHCGNAENEAEYCGICGMNAAGEPRPTA
jgi:hypothetical protein